MWALIDEKLYNFPENSPYKAPQKSIEKIFKIPFQKKSNPVPHLPEVLVRGSGVVLRYYLIVLNIGGCH